MASESPGLTRTDKNLWSAIVGEALAYLNAMSAAADLTACYTLSDVTLPEFRVI